MLFVRNFVTSFDYRTPCLSGLHESSILRSKVGKRVAGRRRRKPREAKSSVAGGLGRSINRRTINALLSSNEILFGGSSTVASVCFSPKHVCRGRHSMWHRFPRVGPVSTFTQKEESDSNEERRKEQRERERGMTKRMSSNKNASVRQYLRNVNTSWRGWIRGGG